MAGSQVQFRRGTTLQHSTFTGAIGEVTVDTDKHALVVHDGATPGGFPNSGATGGADDNVFFLNDQTINNDYTVPASKNAGSFGPISIASGKTVTIPSGSVWSIV